MHGKPVLWVFEKIYLLFLTYSNIGLFPLTVSSEIIFREKLRYQDIKSSKQRDFSAEVFRTNTVQKKKTGILLMMTILPIAILYYSAI